MQVRKVILVYKYACCVYYYMFCHVILHPCRSRYTLNVTSSEKVSIIELVARYILAGKLLLCVSNNQYTVKLAHATTCNKRPVAVSDHPKVLRMNCVLYLYCIKRPFCLSETCENRSHLVGNVLWTQRQVSITDEPPCKCFILKK